MAASIIPIEKGLEIRKRNFSLEGKIPDKGVSVVARVRHESGILEAITGYHVDIVPKLLEFHKKGMGVFLSEQDIRLMQLRGLGEISDTLLYDYRQPKITDFGWMAGTPPRENSSQNDQSKFFNLKIPIPFWTTSTLCMLKDDLVKTILPYTQKDKQLTEAAILALSWIQPDEKYRKGRDSSYPGYFKCNMELNHQERWERLEGPGVYTLKRNELFKRKGRGRFSDSWRLKDGITKKQAQDCTLLRVRLGHPSEVDSDFAVSEEEFNFIINKIYASEKKHGENRSMMQWIMGKENFRMWNCYGPHNGWKSTNWRNTYQPGGGDIGDEEGIFAFFIPDNSNPDDI